MQYNKMKNILLLVTALAGCGAFVVFSGSHVIQNDRTGAVYPGRVYTYQ